MEKTSTLNLRVNPNLKKSAEDILARLGIPMSTAIDIYLNQITMTGGIPFPVTLPKVPDAINADMMSIDEIRNELKLGIDDIENGNVQDAILAFEEFEEKH